MNQRQMDQSIKGQDLLNSIMNGTKNARVEDASKLARQYKLEPEDIATVIKHNITGYLTIDNVGSRLFGSLVQVCHGLVGVTAYYTSTRVETINDIKLKAVFTTSDELPFIQGLTDENGEPVRKITVVSTTGQNASNSIKTDNELLKRVVNNNTPANGMFKDYKLTSDGLAILRNFVSNVNDLNVTTIQDAGNKTIIVVDGIDCKEVIKTWFGTRNEKGGLEYEITLTPVQNANPNLSGARGRTIEVKQLNEMVLNKLMENAGFTNPETLGISMDFCGV